MDWTWEGFLRLLSEPNAIAAAVGIAWSWLAEYVPGFRDLVPKWKRLVFLGLCLLIPVIAASLGILTCGWTVSWNTVYWPALLAGFIAFGGGTVAHTRSL